MSTIFLTGFAPFDGEKTNPSWEAVQKLDGKRLSTGHLIHIAQLPCEFGAAIIQLENHIHRIQPEIVICIGQAGGRSDISLERVAINIDDARIPDNVGAQPIDQAIDEDGPVAYFSSLPIKAMVKALKDQGIPASVSQSAGTYVCNHVFYGLMHYSDRHTYPKRAGFVHIPYLPEQACAHTNAPSMSLATMTMAIELMLETCLATENDLKVSAGSIC
jgi:pyroglutamyl-peptidase